MIFIAILAINLYSVDAILFSLGFKTDSSFLQVYIMIFAAVMVFLLSVQYFTAIRHLQSSIKQTQDAEIAFLRAQINPHFLYNALNSVAALCATVPEKAEEVVLELSKYLRRSFDFKRMDAMSTLAQELELLEAYLYIEKTRFGDRLEVVYDIDETLNFPVPPLVLQPLVENAVKHGLMGSIVGGTVKISIRPEGDEAVFTIEDNGIGMETGKPGQLLEESAQTGGIGVRNIDRRLKMLYSRGLSIRSEKGRGTQVRFALPLRQEEHRKKRILPWR
ncbi:sensor histidine kinase [Sporobacter termitidis]|uniref:sensor histidine kinase n=1 Tax=Sporobacter termitidis TaxID=44749 RepID=UPI001FA90878|nr:histidine kinase [Sporobacter termitidis]